MCCVDRLKSHRQTGLSLRPRNLGASELTVCGLSTISLHMHDQLLYAYSVEKLTVISVAAGI